MGGAIKMAEFISGRFADVVSNLYLGYACLWFAENNKNVQGIDKVLDYAMTKIEHDIQEAFFGIFKNFPIPLIGPVMRLATFPRGREYSPPSDKQRAAVSDMITTPTAMREMLTQDVFISKNPKDRVNMISRAIGMCYEADKILATCRKEKRTPMPDEQARIDAAEAMREEIIQVDSFPTLGGKEHNTEWMKPTWKPQPILTVEPASSQQHA
jgi:hypothetical protein